MTASVWPRDGRCGACGRAAREFPSRRWEHVSRPCRARSQSMWGIDSIDIKNAVRFVPEGEELPAGPNRWHWHPNRTDGDGAIAAFDLCRDDHSHTVREFLAREAEEAVR